MKHQFFTLDNGLRVILIDTGTFPTLSALLLVGAGSRYENEKNNGIAHFFEHMAFKGSKKYPNSLILASTIEGLGGVFNAFTTKDHTGYWIKATVEHFDTVIDVLADMILNPILSEEEIDREKGVIVQEINMYEDMPQSQVGELFENLIYKGNPLGFDVIGRKDTVVTFNRKTFTDYMRNLYHPKNAVLVIAGGLKENGNYLEIIKDKFGGWQQGKKAVFKIVKKVQKTPQNLIKHKKTEQTHFVLGFRAFSLFDPGKYTLSLLATLLGGGASSRLFIEVRERRGLAYYISTSTSLYQDTGSISTQAGVGNNLENLREAITVTLDEHRNIAKGRITQDEFVRAKEMVKGRLLLALEDSYRLASFLGTPALLEDKIETPDEVIRKLNAVKLEEVVDLADKLFKPKNLNFSLIGPFEKSKDFDRILSI